jgi:hypothetical protein
MLAREKVDAPPAHVLQQEKLGERRISARQGWAGENRDFFSSLLAKSCNLHHH